MQSGSDATDDFLYVPSWHKTHTKPFSSSSPVNPGAQAHNLALLLPGGDCEFGGPVTQAPDP